MSVLEVFEHAHWSRCTNCHRDVVEVAGPRRGVMFIDPRAAKFDVAWRLATDHTTGKLKVLAWQVYDGRAAIIYEVIRAGGFQRSHGDSIHVSHVCQELPSDWFESGLVAGLGLPSVLF